MSQLSHTTTPFISKKFPIVVICDGLNGPANIGALFRTCEAFGVSEIIFCNAEIEMSSPRIKKTARGAQEKISYKLSDDILAEINSLKNRDYQCVALEITETSIPIEKLILSNRNIALVIGSEQDGISEKALGIVSQSTHITMYGENSSMNVIQATSIALHQLTKL
ncbi:SpoU rRNA methylase family protein [Ulvibacter sp. MAR_2010_11]|uniref:TrmH family RNA methyltransferase n=1 Tax=Ulvibacter sp. MAR_2010_11 TaxID=1250229 RepID=UPI000C2B63F7|nr:TrmH family RNA methyltransferase [Ulvibacter sp. MAR_2010_11]PKA84234.1 SpoU rRNA methylase family protein [Ulvibacter sp. MAR_2010_11]